MFESLHAIPGPEFIQRMNARGVKMLNRGGRRVRAVTHCMISAADIEEVLVQVSQLAREVA
jgi:hypothetical protein